MLLQVIAVPHRGQLAAVVLLWPSFALSTLVRHGVLRTFHQTNEKGARVCSSEKSIEPP